jgi:hypothetical protein
VSGRSSHRCSSNKARRRNKNRRERRQIAWVRVVETSHLSFLALTPFLLTIASPNAISSHEPFPLASRAGKVWRAGARKSTSFRRAEAKTEAKFPWKYFEKSQLKYCVTNEQEKNSRVPKQRAVRGLPSRSTCAIPSPQGSQVGHDTR